MRHHVATISNMHCVELAAPKHLHSMQAGRTPLHLACATGNLPMVRLLSRVMQRLSLPDLQGQRPLHCCVTPASNSDVKLRCLAVLVRQGAYLDACDQLGWTATHHAAQSGNLMAVQLLCQAGCNQDQINKVLLLCGLKYSNSCGTFQLAISHRVNLWKSTASVSAVCATFEVLKNASMAVQSTLTQHCGLSIGHGERTRCRRV